jgi:hypothetical protein
VPTASGLSALHATVSCKWTIRSDRVENILKVSLPEGDPTHTGMPTAAAYSGYVRLETTLALSSLPPHVTLLIGLPAYHTSEPGHISAEAVADAIRGVRLALGASAPPRPVGVALYADFSATAADWAAYTTGWTPMAMRK